ncbi:MAG: hypothetical protein ABSF45_29215 [Terriglobia bacterium]|jgi:hypothetical protein
MTAEERLAKVEEHMLVQAGLVARFERRIDAFTEKTEAWIESAETRFARLEVFATAVLERMDRFIAGQEGNGHKIGG